MILSSLNTKIICDPWFKGTAFGDGWSLLHDNSHDINQLDFDYIWISHEHPDHFSIPTLKDLRKTQTFLFQETRDKKVKSFLEKKGHRVIELKNKQPTKIGDIELTCIVCDGYDSSLLAKFPDDTLMLNINDARVELRGHLENDILPLIKDKNLNLLAFQFGYANWAGNEGDSEIPKYLQQISDEKNDYAISLLKPKAIMPFASFVYFSHQENFFWNSYNWFKYVFDHFDQSTSELIFPSPNQTIALDKLEKIDFSIPNNNAYNFWNEKHENIKPKHKSTALDLDDIKSQYLTFCHKIHKSNTLFDNLCDERNFILKMKVTDLNLTLKVGLIQPYFETSKSSDDYSCEVSSETAHFLFEQLFARGTISINGRIKFNYEHAHTFFLFFFIPYANNIGIYFSEIGKITISMLQSISRTAVMHSIIQFNDVAHRNMMKDISLLAGVLDNQRPSDDLYDVFNEEPQNEDLS